MRLNAITRRMTTFGAAAVIGLAAFGAGGSAQAQSAAKGKTVEYITFGLQFEYQVALVNGIKKRAADAGVVPHVIDGKGDPNLQVTEVLDAVTKKPDALLINPVDAKLLVAGVKRTNEAKIPVFIMENPPPEGEYLAIVDFDNVAGGAMGADELARAIGNKGVVLETRGSTGSEQAELRHKGFTEEMKKFPGVEVKSLNTEWVADNAYKMVLDALTQNPNVKGVFSHNDEMIRGVVSALRQTNKLLPASDPGHIAVVGLDGTPLALQRIREATQDATVEQSPIAMGSFIFDQILAYFDGKPIEKRGKPSPPSSQKPMSTTPIAGATSRSSRPDKLRPAQTSASAAGVLFAAADVPHRTRNQASETVRSPGPCIPPVIELRVEAIAVDSRIGDESVQAGQKRGCSRRAVHSTEPLTRRWREARRSRDLRTDTRCRHETTTAMNAPTGASSALVATEETGEVQLRRARLPQRKNRPELRTRCALRLRCDRAGGRARQS